MELNTLSLDGAPNCQGNNQKVLDLARSLKPSVVVLAGIWLRYEAREVAGTVKALHDAGILNVVILGPAPAWTEVPARTVLKLWKDDPLHRVPSPRLDYSRFGMLEGPPPTGSPARHVVEVEGALRKAAEEGGAAYVSVMSEMCNPDGCLMRASSESGDSFYLDTVHLNRLGAEFVVRSISPRIVSLLPR